MRVAIALVAVLVLAGCASGRTTVSTVTVTTPGSPKMAAPGPQNTGYFGQIVSVTGAPDSSRLLLVLRPQFYLVGVTANTALAAQQGNHCAPLSCPGVEDDRLVVSAGSQQLTFVLPAKTKGTVLTLSGSKTQTTTVSAAQLAALVAGAKTPKLVEPLSSGVWLAVDTDRITSFAQQFEP